VKYLFLTFFSLNVWAGETCDVKTSENVATKSKVINTNVPKYLEGAVIVVRQANGTESVVKAEEFKVVPRKRQVLVTELTSKTIKVCQSNRQSRVSLHVGKGPQGGLDRDASASTVEVESQFGVLGGLQYQYRFEDSNWSISGQLQSNETGLLGVGYDF
jgi:hypothetical protein